MHYAHILDTFCVLSYNAHGIAVTLYNVRSREQSAKQLLRTLRTKSDYEAATNTIIYDKAKPVKLTF